MYVKFPLRPKQKKSCNLDKNKYCQKELLKKGCFHTLAFVRAFYSGSTS